MGYFSNLKNYLLTLHIIHPQSFGPNEALPVSIPQVTQQPPSLPSPPPSQEFQPLMVAQSNATSMATPSPPPPRSISELAIPAALAVSLYGSIPVDVQLHPDSIFYPPLVAFICLTVLTSLSIIVYALEKPDRGASAGVESTEQKAMGVALVFLLVAFVLRVLLLLPATSLGLTGSVVLVGAVMAAVIFFLQWKKEEIDDPLVPESVPDYSVQNPS